VIKHINIIINIYFIIIILNIYYISYIINPFIFYIYIVLVWARSTLGLPNRDPPTCLRLVLPDRDQRNLTETMETWPRPWKLGRDKRNRHGWLDRPTHTSINAQTKVSEVNLSLRIM